MEGHAPGNFSDEYLETLALYRKIVERLLEWDTLLFHGSCISVDSKAYLFTAKSGTGKSTHTQLWKKLFGERAVFINDDKPLLKISAQGVTVYGTPWDGKHHRSTNTSCPLKAVCILTRNTENSIQRIDKKAALPMLCQQSYRPCSPTGAQKNAGSGESAGQQRAAVPAGLQHGTGGRTGGLPRNEQRIEGTHMQTILPPSGNTIKIIGQGSVCGTGSALDALCSGAAGGRRRAGVPHPDAGAAAAHAGRICRAGQPARPAGRLVPGAAEDERPEICRSGAVFSRQTMHKSPSTLPTTSFLPQRTATPGAFTATSWGAPASP